MSIENMDTIEAMKRGDELYQIAVAAEDDFIVIDESLIMVFVNHPFCWFPPQNVIPAFRVPPDTVLLCILKDKKVVMPTQESGKHA